MPAEPGDFATDPKVVAAKHNVALQAAAAEKLSMAKQAGKKAKRKEDGFPNAEDFLAEWWRYKDKFKVAQYEKCAYCEGKPLITGDGTIDHFRPRIFEYLIESAKYAGMCRYIVSKRWGA